MTTNGAEPSKQEIRLEDGTLANGFDLQMADRLDNLAQRMSRRGVLAKLGKWSLGLAGASAGLTLLPVDRAFGVVEELDVMAVSRNCRNWKLCGLWGWLCDCCNGSGRGIDQCPACGATGHNWKRCCCNPNTANTYEITYADCCNFPNDGLHCGEEKIGQCVGCLGCENHPREQPYWCYSDRRPTPDRYICTKVITGAVCGGCPRTLV